MNPKFEATIQTFTKQRDDSVADFERRANCGSNTTFFDGSICRLFPLVSEYELFALQLVHLLRFRVWAALNDMTTATLKTGGCPRYVSAVTASICHDGDTIYGSMTLMVNARTELHVGFDGTNRALAGIGDDVLLTNILAAIAHDYVDPVELARAAGIAGKANVSCYVMEIVGGHL